MELAQLVEFARGYTAAWCSMDPGRVAAFYSARGALCVNGAAPAIGRSAIGEIARGFMTAFPDLELTMDDLLVKDDRAFYHWTFVGTNIGPGGTGHRVRFSGFEEWKIGADGLIAESQGHFDEALYQRQLTHGLDEN